MSTVADILTRVGYLTQQDQTAISSTSQPTDTECIAWINEAIGLAQSACHEMSSELGRTTATITTVAGTCSYADLAALMLCPGEIMDKDGNVYNGWLEETYNRPPLKLVTLGATLGASPAVATDQAKPSEFYIDADNNVVFPTAPDDAYSAVIVYYPIPTALTASTDTMPYNGYFDSLIAEYVGWKANNREEYDTTEEKSQLAGWYEKMRRLIITRRGPRVRIVF